MAALQADLEAQRLARMTHNARPSTVIYGPISTCEDAGVILWTYTCPELYELLVVKQSWPLERYGRFVADALIGHLLPAV